MKDTVPADSICSEYGGGVLEMGREGVEAGCWDILEGAEGQ